MKKITRTLWVIIACMLVFSSCGNSNSFWTKDNEIPIIINFDVIDDEENSKTVLDQEIETTEEATDDVYLMLYNEKDSIIKYFAKEYGVNVSFKLEKLQKIIIFTQKNYNGESLGGFVNEADVVYLNQNIIDDTDLMRSVMVHEIIHYLGVKPADDGKCRYLIEGLTDAIAQDVVEQEGNRFITTSLYEMQRELAKQMIAANKNVVRDFIEKENFSLPVHIDTVLKEVPLRTKTEVNSISEHLENCITSVYYGTAEETEDTETARVQAQFIVAAYCKEFNPEKETIKVLRKHYIVQDFEEIEIE